jgi:hypothetical protein
MIDMPAVAEKPGTATTLRPRLKIVMLESESDALILDIKNLNLEIEISERHLRLARAMILEERAHVLGLLVDRASPSPAFERGESFIAQAVLAAQNRVK